MLSEVPNNYTAVVMLLLLLFAGATELAQLFKNLGNPLPLEKVAEVFMKYDKDQSGQIDFGETQGQIQLHSHVNAPLLEGCASPRTSASTSY